MTETIALQTDILRELEMFGLTDILLWLLSFAILYGVLTQAKIPQSQVSRALISIAVAFLVIFAAAGTNIPAIFSQLSTSLILVILGVLVLVVFLEVGGVKQRIYTPTKEGGFVPIKGEEVSFFQKHPTEIAFVLLIVAVLIFIGAGGLSLLGIEATLGSQSVTTILLFGVVILAVAFVIFKGGS